MARRDFARGLRLHAQGGTLSLVRGRPAHERTVPALRRDGRVRARTAAAVLQNAGGDPAPAEGAEPVNRDALVNQLIIDEGLKLSPYTDTVGKLTIGVGRNLTDVGI